MIRFAITRLLKIELPDHTIRLCDGGFQNWSSEKFVSRDSVFGTVSHMEAITFGDSGQVPELNLAFSPDAEATPAQLIQPAFQGSPVYLWTAQYNVDTGAVIGTPVAEFAGVLDRMELELGVRTEQGRSRFVEIIAVPYTEALLSLDIGNTMNPIWHKSIWAGETGHDQATGLGKSVAWGTDKPVGSNTPYTPSPYSMPGYDPVPVNSWRTYG